MRLAAGLLAALFPVYVVGVPVYIGCFLDGMPRDLSGAELRGSMTLEMCQSFCTGHASGPFVYIGLEHQDECYCGNTYGDYGASDESLCNTPCNGDPLQMCGGGNRNSVWQIIVTSAPATAVPTAVPATQSPPTSVPATAAPTNAPATSLPSTQAPATDAPPTDPPATLSPTSVPTTLPPATSAPATDAPATLAPPTPAPTTVAPATPAPATDAPATPAPATVAPATPAPTTEAPATHAPATPSPETSAPETGAPTTLPPATLPPATSAPATDAPVTLTPTTPSPTSPSATLPPSPTDAPSTPTSTTASPAPAPAPPTDTPATPQATIPPSTTPGTTQPRTPPPQTTAPGTPTTQLPPAPPTTAPLRISPATEVPDERIIARKLPAADPIDTGATAAFLGGAMGGSAGSATRLLIVSSSCKRGVPEPLNPTGVLVDGSQDVGAEIMNIAFTVGSALLAYFALRSFILLTTHCVPSLSRLDAQGFLRLPSIPHLIFQFCYQSMTLAGMNLTMYHEQQWHAVVGVATLLLCVAIPAWLLAVLQRDATVHATYAVSHTRQASCALRYWLGPGEWVNLRRERLWVERYTSAVRRFRPEGVWFLGIEYAAAFALSALKSTAPESSIGCGHVKAASACIFLGLLGLQIVHKPYVKPRDAIAEFVLNALQTSALIFMANAYYTDTTVGFDVAGVLLFVAVCVLLFKVVLDAANVVYLFCSGRRQALQEDVFEQLDHKQKQDEEAFLVSQANNSYVDLLPVTHTHSISDATPREKLLLASAKESALCEGGLGAAASTASSFYRLPESRVFSPESSFLSDGGPKGRGSLGASIHNSQRVHAVLQHI